MVEDLRNVLNFMLVYWQPKFMLGSLNCVWSLSGGYCATNIKAIQCQCMTLIGSDGWFVINLLKLCLLDNSDSSKMIYMVATRKLNLSCRRTSRPSLTFQSFRLWTVFLPRYGRKWTEMTGTQHVGTLEHLFLQYITINKIFICLKHIFYLNFCYYPFCFFIAIYRLQFTTFWTLMEVAIFITQIIEGHDRFCQ
jgi:hypothetical protein